MRVGTKSVLFGAHAFWFHPYVVWRAFRRLYGRQPTFWEAVCILAHDLGYWGKPNMDGPEGETHPEGGARLVAWLYKKLHFSRCDWAASHWYCWTVYHSRYYAHKHNANPSDLCWADKASIWFEPEWFYLLRVRLSGEQLEFRLNATKCIPLWLPDRCWLHWYKNKVIAQVSARTPAKQGHHLDEKCQEIPDTKNSNILIAQ